MELFRPAKDSVPLSARLVPRNLEEFIGQKHILSPGKLLRRAIESDRLFSTIFFGPPGCGKTALSKVIANYTKASFYEENAATIGVSEIREIIKISTDRLRAENKKTILVLDEIHRFNKSQQDALLPDVEKGNIILIGITTENPYFYVNKTLLSRSLTFEFKTLTRDELSTILHIALNDKERGLGKLKIEMTKEAKEHLVTYSEGDARKLLNAVEIGALTTPKRNGKIIFDLNVAEESIQKKALIYDKSDDQHYDHISAFIKSMRGSDPDAALYWLAKMLIAGEDPRFIARRIVILASEDIGNADPQALVVATSALNAVEFVGMPEAELALAQATIYMSTAPKSNSVYKAITAAKEEVEKGEKREVPLHLKDPHRNGEKLGHGKNYLYPHSFPGGIVSQSYMPKPKVFYRPNEIGYEKEIKKRLSEWRKILKK